MINQSTNNLFKNSRTNWNYILIVVILGILAGGGILGYYYSWITELETKLAEIEVRLPAKVTKDETEKLSLTRRVFSDQEVYEILQAFAEEKFIGERSEIGYNKILLAALEFKDGSVKENLEKIKKELTIWGDELQDAPDLRSFTSAYTKTCIAESIIYDDLKNTLQRCGKKDMKPTDIQWIENSVTIVDDINASSQILPYFLTGVAYYVEGDSSRVDYYFRQIKLHRQVGIEQYGENDFFLVAGETYIKMVAKVDALSLP